MFRDHRLASDWLPEDVLITEFEDASFSAAADYEEDIDLTTGSAEGSRIEGSGLQVWKEQEIRFRDGGPRANHVVYLGWRRPRLAASDSQTPMYTIELGRHFSDRVGMMKKPLLVFSLAKSDQALPSGHEDENTEPEDQREEGGEQSRGQREPDLTDISIGIISQTGRSVRRPLSHFRAIPPALPTRYTKLSEDIQYFGNSYEPVLQTFEVDLASLVGPSRADVNQIKAVCFIFDQSREGFIILDNVGFAESGDGFGEKQD